MTCLILNTWKVSRSRLAAELWRRHKTGQRHVRYNPSCEDSEQGSRGNGFTASGRRDKGRDCTKEKSMSNGGAAADMLGSGSPCTLHHLWPVHCES